MISASGPGRPSGRVRQVVGEVGLPGLVGLFGFEADVGAFRALGRVRGYLPGAGQDPVDRGPGQRDLVVVVQVPADRVRAGVQAGLVEPFAEPQDEVDRCWWGGGGVVFGARERGSDAASPSAL